MLFYPDGYFGNGKQMKGQKDMKEVMISLFVSLVFHGFVLSSLAFFYDGGGATIGPMAFVDVSLEMDGRMMGEQGRGMVSPWHKPESFRNKGLHGENTKPVSRPEQLAQERIVNDSPVEPDHHGSDYGAVQSGSDEPSSENVVAGYGNAGTGHGASGAEGRSESSGSSGLSGSSGKELDGVQEASPLYRNNPPPSYPMSARARRLEGTVELNVLVDVKGRVRDLNLRKTSGYIVLDRAAMDAVKQWRFEPGKTSCCPMEMWVVVPMVFKLTEA